MGFENQQIASRISSQRDCPEQEGLAITLYPYIFVWASMVKFESYTPKTIQIGPIFIHLFSHHWVLHDPNSNLLSASARISLYASECTWTSKSLIFLGAYILHDRHMYPSLLESQR